MDEEEDDARLSLWNGCRSGLERNRPRRNSRSLYAQPTEAVPSTFQPVARLSLSLESDTIEKRKSEDILIYLNKLRLVSVIESERMKRRTLLWYAENFEGRQNEMIELLSYFVRLCSRWREQSRFIIDVAKRIELFRNSIASSEIGRGTTEARAGMPASPKWKFHAPRNQFSEISSGHVARTATTDLPGNLETRSRPRGSNNVFQGHWTWRWFND